jgi:transcriptional regulator with XRE-family HTH domain
VDGGLDGPAAPLDGLLRGWRQAAGLTQRDLAARSGLSVTAVRDLEQGRSHRPQAGSLAALVGALGLDAAQTAATPATARPGDPARPQTGQQPPGNSPHLSRKTLADPRR